MAVPWPALAARPVRAPSAVLTAAAPSVSGLLAGEVMVKQPEPCPNESGECIVEGCDRELSTLWYGKKGAKYCKHCYDTALGPKKRKGSPTAEMQQAVEQAGDTLIKIIKICGTRCARALEPAPASVRASGSLVFGACANLNLP